MKSHRFQGSCLSSVNCLLDFGQRTLFVQGQMYKGRRWMREAGLHLPPAIHMKWLASSVFRWREGGNVAVWSLSCPIFPTSSPGSLPNQVLSLPCESHFNPLILKPLKCWIFKIICNCSLPDWIRCVIVIKISDKRQLIANIIANETFETNYSVSQAPTSNQVFSKGTTHTAQIILHSWWALLGIVLVCQESCGWLGFSHLSLFCSFFSREEPAVKEANLKEVIKNKAEIGSLGSARHGETSKMKQATMLLHYSELSPSTCWFNCELHRGYEQCGLSSWGKLSLWLVQKNQGYSFECYFEDQLTVL